MIDNKVEEQVVGISSGANPFDGPVEEKEVETGPLTQRIVSKRWDTRVLAYEELAKLMGSSAGEGAENLQTLYNEHHGKFQKYIVDTHPGAQEKALEAFIVFFKTYPKAQEKGDLYLKILIEKILISMKPAIKKKCKETALEVFKLAEDFEALCDMPLSLLTIKNMKVVASALQMATFLLLNFGLKAFPLKKFLSPVEKLATSTNPGVRTEVMNFFTEAYKWAKEVLVPIVDKLKKAQSDELHKRFEEIDKELDGKRPQPLMLTITEEKKRAEEEAKRKEEEAKGLVSSAPAQEEEAKLDPYDFAEEKSVISKFNDTWCDKLCNLKTWKEKKAKLESFCEMASVDKMKNESYVHLLNTFKKLLKDSNIVVVQQTIKAIGILAKGLRNNFAYGSKIMFATILQKFKDRKLIAEVHSCFDRMKYSINIQEHIDDFKDTLKDKNPLIRLNAMMVLQKILPETDQQKIQGIRKQLITMMKGLIDDPDGAVRKIVLEVVGILKFRLGDSVTTGMDLNQQKMKIINDTVAGLRGSGADFSGSSSNELEESKKPQPGKKARNNEPAREKKKAVPKDEPMGVDICSMITPKLLELLQHKSYSEREKAIPIIEKIVAASNNKLPAKDIGPLMDAFKARLNDPNKNLLKRFLRLFSNLAVAVGPGMKNFAKLLLKALIPNLADKNKQVREEALCAVNQYAEACGNEIVMNYAIGFLQDGTQELRKEILSWLIEKKESFTQVEKDNLAPSIVACLLDKAKENRDKADILLGVIVPIIGSKPFDIVIQDKTQANKNILNNFLKKYTPELSRSGSNQNLKRNGSKAELVNQPSQGHIGQRIKGMSSTSSIELHTDEEMDRCIHTEPSEGRSDEMEEMLHPGYNNKQTESRTSPISKNKSMADLNKKMSSQSPLLSRVASSKLIQKAGHIRGPSNQSNSSQKGKKMDFIGRSKIPSTKGTSNASGSVGLGTIAIVIGNVSVSDKQKRFAADKKHKWPIDEVRKPLLEKLKQHLKAILNPNLFTLMFDQKTFQKYVDAILYFKMGIEMEFDEIINILDLIVKWVFVRFWDNANTAVTKNILEFLNELLQNMIKGEYTLWENEAEVLLPLLIEKLGINSHPFREKIRDQIMMICKLYEPKKAFSCLIKGLQITKNKKTQSEILITAQKMLETYSIEISTYQQGKTISQMVNSTDSNIRNSAIGTMAVLYKALGDAIWEDIVGDVPPKVKDMLEQRFNQINKNKTNTDRMKSIQKKKKSDMPLRLPTPAEEYDIPLTTEEAEEEEKLNVIEQDNMTPMNDIENFNNLNTMNSDEEMKMEIEEVEMEIDDPVVEQVSVDKKDTPKRISASLLERYSPSVGKIEEFSKEEEERDYEVKRIELAMSTIEERANSEVDNSSSKKPITDLRYFGSSPHKSPRSNFIHQQQQQQLQEIEEPSLNERNEAIEQIEEEGVIWKGAQISANPQNYEEQQHIDNAVSAASVVAEKEIVVKKEEEAELIPVIEIGMSDAEQQQLNQIQNDDIQIPQHAEVEREISRRDRNVEEEKEAEVKKSGEEEKKGRMKETDLQESFESGLNHSYCRQIDLIVERLKSGEIGKKVDSLVNLNEMITNFERDKEILIQNNKLLIDTFTYVIQDIFNKPISQIPIRFAKYCLTVANKICSIKVFLTALNSQSLYYFIEEILTKLLFANLDQLGQKGEGDTMMRNLNSIMLRLLENCDPTNMFTVLLDLLKKYIGSVEFPKLPGLIVKCLLKLTKILEILLPNLDISKIILKMHEYLLVHPAHPSSKGSHEELGTRIVKTIINELVKFKKEEIWNYYSILNSHQQTDLHIKRWIQIILKSLQVSQPLSSFQANDRKSEYPSSLESDELREIFKSLNDKSTYNSAIISLSEYIQKHPDFNLDSVLKDCSTHFSEYVREGLEKAKSSSGIPSHYFNKLGRRSPKVENQIPRSIPDLSQNKNVMPIMKSGYNQSQNISMQQQPGGQNLGMSMPHPVKKNSDLRLGQGGEMKQQMQEKIGMLKKRFQISEKSKPEPFELETLSNMQLSENNLREAERSENPGMVGESRLATNENINALNERRATGSSHLQYPTHSHIPQLLSTSQSSGQPLPQRQTLEHSSSPISQPFSQNRSKLIRPSLATRALPSVSENPQRSSGPFPATNANLRNRLDEMRQKLNQIKKPPPNNSHDN